MEKTIGIIGYGRFGELWAKHCATIGQVYVYDTKKITRPLPPNCTRASLRKVATADILFFAVPISHLEAATKRVSGFLNPKTIVADVSSVKLFTAEVLKRNLPVGQRIIGVHPLFGPDSAGNAKTLSGFKIVVAPVRISSKEQRGFIEILKLLHLEILITTSANHDRQMANSQGLIHFIGRGLEGLNLKPQEIATKDYTSLLNIKDMVVNDTWQLFLDMHQYNKFAYPIRKKFMKSLLEVEKTLDRGRPTISSIRIAINELDTMIIESLAHRMSLAKKIGRLKKKETKSITDKKREQELHEIHTALCRKFGIDYKEVAKIFSVIINYSKKVQSA